MGRLQAFFSGTVQGVGFRYTAERLARRYPLRGYVRNLPTGQVEVVAEGEEKILREFLQALEEAFRGQIRKTDVSWEKSSGEYRDFRIRF